MKQFLAASVVQDCNAWRAGVHLCHVADVVLTEPIVVCVRGLSNHYGMVRITHLKTPFTVCVFLDVHADLLCDTAGSLFMGQLR